MSAKICALSTNLAGVGFGQWRQSSFIAWRMERTNTYESMITRMLVFRSKRGTLDIDPRLAQYSITIILYITHLLVTISNV